MLLRYLDVVLIVATLPIALLVGAPVAGCVIGAAIWVAQRIIAEFVVDRARHQDDVRTALKLNMLALVGRAWLVVVGILVAGVAIGKEHGAAACVVVLCGFTIYLLMTVVFRSLQGESAHS